MQMRRADGERMRVAVDGTTFEIPGQRGIQRYFYELLSRVGTRWDVVIGLGRPAVAPLPPGCRVVGPDGVEPRHRFDVLRRARRRSGRRARERAVAASDVTHSSYFAPPPVGLPNVVTLYDMIPELLPEWFGDMDESIAAKREALRAATHIVSISQASTDDVIRCYPWCQGRVTTTHPGVDHFPRIEACRGPARSADAGTYALFVGDRPRYKNFRTLCEAVASPGWPAGCNLSVVGKPFSDAETMLLDRLGVGGRVAHRGRVSDGVLSGLYYNAAAMVFPSLAEGFGFPLLEAQQCRCPVACSDIAVFRELAGESVVYFDPRDPSSVAEAVARVRDPAMADELRRRGEANARQYTWHRCATQTVAAYEAACQPAGRRPPADDPSSRR